MKNLLVVSGVLMAFACNQKKDEAPPPAPEQPKVVEKMKEKAPPAAAPVDLPVTSKSPEAVKQVQQAADLITLARGNDAVALLKKALELDPDFAQAHALLGLNTPGPEGVDHLNKAVALSDKLPEAEKDFVGGLAAMRAGDDTKAITSLEKTVELAPGAWRVELMLGYQHTAAGDPEGAIKALSHALSINPNLPQAQNVIAYAYAHEREWDKALAAAQKQVELLPKEPNPEDSLGEIQLWAGKFDDSEKSFQKAIALEPTFTMAWQGVALARAYRGDYKGAYEALDHEKTSTVPGEKYDALFTAAYLALAEGKLPKALESVDAIDKDPAAKAQPHYAFVPVIRGQLLALGGKPADAAKAYAGAMARADQLAGDGKQELVRDVSIGELWLAAMAGKPAADTDKLVAVFADEAKASPTNKTKQSMASHAYGLAIWAKAGPKEAVTYLSNCMRLDVMCRADLSAAKRKSGDAAGADAIDKEIQETPLRDGAVVYFRAHAAKK
jgi:tetratricopeptide (TPR) repeat protein